MVLISILLYLIRIIILGFAVGTAFIRLKLFTKLSNGQVLLLGVAATPMFISLIDYLLGLVFIGWSSWFYFIVPLVISLIYLRVKKNYRVCFEACKDIWIYMSEYVKSLGKWVILDGFIALGMLTIFLVIFWVITPDTKNYVIEVYHSLTSMDYLMCSIVMIVASACLVLLFRKKLKNGTLGKNLYIIAIIVVVGSASLHALTMLDLPIVDSDRAHYELNARYFLEDKNSWEVDNYSDEKYGSTLQDDHGPLWVMYLADAKIVADIIGMEEHLKCVNFALLWVYICFYYFIFIVALYVGGTYRTGVLSLILFNLYFHTVLEIIGSRDAFRFVGLMLLFMYVINQFEEIAEGESPWYKYLIMFLFCYLSMNGHEGNVYIMFGMFIVFFIMLLKKKTPIKHFGVCWISVFWGTVLGITKTIRIYLTTGRIASSTILPFHDTPIVEQIAKVNEQRADLSTILATYTYSVRFMIVLGIIGILVMLVTSLKRGDKKKMVFSLLVIGMLLPMMGIMNWSGYEVSLWFAAQLRYRMYFLMLFAITGAWIITRKYKVKTIRVMSILACLVSFVLFTQVELARYMVFSRAYVNSCINTVRCYEKIADTISSVADGDVFTADQGLVYYLHGTPRLLYHSYTEELIQAKTDEEIKTAIENLNIGAIVLPYDGHIYHDYSLLPFWDYINEHFSKITPTDGGYSMNNIIFYRCK